VWLFSNVRILEWGSPVTVKAVHSNSREVLSLDRDAAARRMNHRSKKYQKYGGQDTRWLQRVRSRLLQVRGTPEVHGKMDLSKHLLFQSVRLVGAVGIEPTTFGLKGRCSTTELRPCYLQYFTLKRFSAHLRYVGMKD
jgi:hypothetical protein